MNLSDLNPPFIELPDHQVWHRIQRVSARRDSVRSRGLILPPVGAMSGRFDLHDEATAYLADSELTALYEVTFGRTLFTTLLTSGHAPIASETLRRKDLVVDFDSPQSFGRGLCAAEAPVGRSTGIVGHHSSSACTNSFPEECERHGAQD